MPEDKHELPSSQTQTPSGMVVISETVKITTVTCETEVTNKVTTLDCSENPTEAGRNMREEKPDSDCNQVVFMNMNTHSRKQKFLIVFSTYYLRNE